MKIILIIIVLLVAVGFFVFKPTENTPIVETQHQISATQSGSYEIYSPEKLMLAESGKVVLFFHAPWCPTCRAANTDINKNLSQIPQSVHILKTDYDSNTTLKQKYGVTYQHTFVQVDSGGSLIKKWSRSDTLSKILENIE